MIYRTKPFNFDSLQLSYIDLINLVTGKPELNVSGDK